MQSCYLESRGDMATQEERIKGLETLAANARERLAKIEGKLDAPPPLPKTTHPILIPLISAVCLALLWYLGWMGTQVVEQGKKLTVIDTKLTVLGLQSQAALPQSAFEQSLGDFKQVVADARKKDVKIPPPVVSNIQTKLKDSNLSSPGFWPAVSEFVNYRSFLEGKNISALEALPSCRGPYINSAAVPANQNGQVIGPPIPARIVERNCKVVLDGIEAAHMGYEDCLVIYRGGPIKRLSDVVFQNCIFEIDLSSSPPPEGQKIGETLLAANNLGDVRLP